jgi:hemoglobin/transferrin/lactoferrin receptor protein
MIRKIFTLLLLFTGFAFSQDISLKGKVVDSKTGEAIQNAAVFISHVFISYTNKNGEYHFDGINNGTYDVKVSQPGYKALTEKVSINNGENVKDFSLVSSPIELDEVIVNTDRTEKYLKDSPYSEVFIGKAELESKPFQTLSDALKEEPGLSIVHDGVWGTELSIRGMSRENVVALVDGNRIATSTDVAARFSLIDLNDVERIEVIKGASSSVYGSGATGGIVNIVTKTPGEYEKLSIAGNISTGFNSVNNMSAIAGSVYGGGSSWSSKFSGSYRKAGNIQTPAGELKNSQFEDYSFSGALNVLPFENQTLKVGYQLFKAKDVGIPGGSVFPTNADVRYPDEKREMFSAGYEIKNISKFLYKLSANYSNQFIERNVENIPHTVQNVAATSTTPAKRVSVLKITPRADHRNNNLQLHGNFLIAENNNLVAGIDYWDRKYNGERQKYQTIEVLNSEGTVVKTTNRIIGEKPLPDSKYKSLGIFAQDNAQLIKDVLSLSVGARVDKINVTGETTVNPIYEILDGVVTYGDDILWNKIDDDKTSYSANVGLKYSVNYNLDLTLSLGYSFRSPSLEERFQYIDQGSYVRLGNPNLNSELGRSVDLGLRYYSENVKVISSFFFNYFSDLVVEKPGTFEGKSAYIKTNVGEARLYGFDLSADYNVYSDYVVYAAAAYVKGDDVTAGGNLPQISPLNGNLGVRFDLFNQLNADFSSTLFAAQKNVGAGELTTPGYATFNITLGTKSFYLSSMNFKIYAGIENLLDKNYRNHLSTTRGSLTIEPGRNFFVKLAAGI